MPNEAELQALATDLVRQAEADGVNQLAVGAAIVFDGKLLIMKRADHDDVFPGHYEIPGGGVDEGEDLLVAVKRETKEETGLDISRVADYCGTFDYRLDDGRLVRQFNFFLDPVTMDVKLDPNEHSVFHWWDPADTVYLDSIQITSLMRECVTDIGKKFA
jgi:8-oxo-dGTP diphosphatase